MGPTKGDTGKEVREGLEEEMKGAGSKGVGEERRRAGKVKKERKFRTHDSFQKSAYGYLI